jgi:hypothetical protein
MQFYWISILFYYDLCVGFTVFFFGDHGNY